MIAKALIQIVDGLNGYLNGIYPNSLDQAEITNIKKSDSTPSNGISVTLINIEEDKVYKNHLNPIPDRLANATSPIHPTGGVPTMRVSLYVLFAFDSLSATSGAYIDSITRLTYVLKYFQRTPYQNISIPTDNDPIEFRLEINYHNISLEDSNNMWSNLGGEQKPYAMYQIKMLEIEAPVLPNDVLDSVLLDPLISNPTTDGNGDPVDKRNIQQINNN